MRLTCVSIPVISLLAVSCGNYSTKPRPDGDRVYTVWRSYGDALAPSFWTFNRCSSLRVQTPAQDSRSAHGLLYLACCMGRLAQSKKIVKVWLTLILRL